MNQSRCKFFLHAKVAQVEPDDKPPDAGTRNPVERYLNRIERVADSYHGRIESSSGDGLLIVFDSAERAMLGACEMQYRCSRLPQASRLKLALCIGVHRGSLRQRKQDLADDAPQIAIQLAQLDDGILVSQDIVDSFGEELSRFVRPFEKPLADMSAFVVDYRQISSETNGGSKPLARLPRTPPFLELCLGLKMMEISEKTPVIAIGRDSSNDWVIAEVYVSSKHCRIERAANEILLVDFSVNGTVVVTENKQEVRIKNGSLSLKGKGMIFLGRPFMGERRGGLRYDTRLDIG